ncbi:MULTISPECIES: NfeD family protein [unclassified Haladaptatus]|uniref:NfeD family protein n=1 Tax=unclassified Haladaptatus TaxID=2622732 RepID=UPI0023E8773C|nr:MULTISPECIES: NfeD family protein [unclassified Haladaptatus]
MVELLDQSLSLLLVVAGTILVVAEALAPGAHFIVLGVALLVSGLIGLALGSVVAPALMPFVLAALVLGTGGAALWAYRNLDIYGGKGTGQTSDSMSLKGQTGRVTETVTNTSGEVKLDAGGFNPFYAARSVHGTIPEGTEIMVVDPGGGNVITVESLEVIEDDIDRELAKGRQEAERVEKESESDAI